MKNNKGQSLIDVIFSIGIVVLVLTGVIVLVVSTAKIKRITFDRQKAVELSQSLIENKILEIKNDPLSFWNGAVALNGTSSPAVTQGVYSYTIAYSSCTATSCNITFNLTWGDNQSLSVNRFFTRQGI